MPKILEKFALGPAPLPIAWNTANAQTHPVRVETLPTPLRAILQIACDRRFCPGREAKLRRKTISGGSFQVCYQCLSCGKTIGQPIAKIRAVHLEPLESWDTVAAEGGQLRLTEAYDAHEDAKADKLAAYNAYLDSPEWRRLRSWVLDRAHGRCEDCNAEAVHVHHLSYERLFHEDPDEDLLAVCLRCHADRHGKTPDQFGRNGSVDG